MLNVAKVMMNGWGKRPHTKNPPLTRPTAAPDASMMRITNQPEAPC